MMNNLQPSAFSLQPLVWLALFLILATGFGAGSGKVYDFGVD